MSVVDAFSERANKASRKPDLPLVRGKAFPILLHPNTWSDDRLCIGVGFVDGAGVSHCKIASDFQFLQCLYGKGVDVDSFALLSDILRTDLHGTAWSLERVPVSDQISFGTPQFAAGLSIPEILNRNYGASVAAGAKSEDLERPRDIAVAVRDEVVKQFGTSAAAAFKGEPISLSNDFGSAAHVRFDLAGAKGAVGEIVAAQAATPSVVKSHLQAAVNKFLALGLHQARSSTNRPMGMFVLAPEERQLEGNKNRNQIIDLIEENIDMARGAGAEVRRSVVVEFVAKDVGQWLGLKSAA